MVGQCSGWVMHGHKVELDTALEGCTLASEC